MHGINLQFINIIIITGAAGIIVSSLLLRLTLERLKMPGLVKI
jgi:hypothetical protein